MEPRYKLVRSGLKCCDCGTSYITFVGWRFVSWAIDGWTLRCRRCKHEYEQKEGVLMRQRSWFQSGPPTRSHPWPVTHPRKQGG